MIRVTDSIDLDVRREELRDLANGFDRLTDRAAFADGLLHLSDGEVGEGTVYREYCGHYCSTGAERRLPAARKGC